jgi:hypothetical protein
MKAFEHNGLTYPTHKLPDVMDDGEPARLQGIWKQCLLRGTGMNANREHTCWMPEPFAIVGMEVTVMESDWRVIDVFSERLNPGTEQQGFLNMFRAPARFQMRVA